MVRQDAEPTAPQETADAVPGRVFVAGLVGLVLMCALLALFVAWDLSYAGTPGNREDEGQLGWLLGAPIAAAIASFVSGAIIGHTARPSIVVIASPGLWGAVPFFLLNPVWGLIVAVCGTAASIAGYACRGE